MIVTVIGARPQFVKAAVVSQALARVGVTETIIHTGQHYDASMSQVFWDELAIPRVSVNLEVGSGAQGRQTGRMIELIEAELLSHGDKVRGVLVYGDTNSTLAAAIAASKLRIDIHHVEAGLRCYDRHMPEEINRTLTDRLSRTLFCPSKSAVEALAAEGIREGVFNVGDVMYDALLAYADVATRILDLQALLPFPAEPYVVLTIHRAANTDDLTRLQAIVDGAAAAGKPVVWPLHPRVKRSASSLRLPSAVHITEPMSYLQMLLLLQHTDAVITDSGGLQKEAYWMKKPCVTARESTEWVETTEGGWNQIVGADRQAIAKALCARPHATWKPLYGAGNAAAAVARQLADILQ